MNRGRKTFVKNGDLESTGIFSDKHDSRCVSGKTHCRQIELCLHADAITIATVNPIFAWRRWELSHAVGISFTYTNSIRPHAPLSPVLECARIHEQWNTLGSTCEK